MGCAQPDAFEGVIRQLHALAPPLKINAAYWSSLDGVFQHVINMVLLAERPKDFLEFLDSLPVVAPSQAIVATYWAPLVDIDDRVIDITEPRAGERRKSGG